MTRQRGTFQQLFGISYSDYLNQTTGASTAERLSQANPILFPSASDVPVELVNFLDNNFNNVQFEADLPTLTDEVFITKRGDLSVSFFTGKSIFNLNAYRERREFQVSQNGEDIFGFGGSWNWNFAANTRSNIRLFWQTTEGQDSTQDERFQATVNVTRNIYSYLYGRIQYSFTDQQSDLPGNEFSENRISASLSMRF